MKVVEFFTNEQRNCGGRGCRCGGAGRFRYVQYLRLKSFVEG